MDLIYILVLKFQVYIGLKITINTISINKTVGISLIILKNFEDLVLVPSLRDFMHLPKYSWYADRIITKRSLICSHSADKTSKPLI